MIRPSSADLSNETPTTSTSRSMRSSSGPESLTAYARRSAVAATVARLYRAKSRRTGSRCSFAIRPASTQSVEAKGTNFEPRVPGEHHQKAPAHPQDQQEGGRAPAWRDSREEKGQTQPPVERIPAVLGFLGYDPFPEPKSIPDQLLLAKPRTLGWSIREAAQRGWSRPGHLGTLGKRGRTIL